MAALRTHRETVLKSCLSLGSCSRDLHARHYVRRQLGFDMNPSPWGQSLPPMVSYAQNGEDVVLQRAFADSDNGFYVDVGACVPVIDSVTLHFYNQGWSGVNVEPDPEYFAEFVEARERDVNLNVAIGGGSHAVTFYPTDIRGAGRWIHEPPLSKVGGRRYRSSNFHSAGCSPCTRRSEEWIS